MLKTERLGLRIVACSSGDVVFETQERIFCVRVDKSFKKLSTSLASSLTLGDEAKQAAKIPLSAEQFVWVYPCLRLDDSPDDPNDLSPLKKFCYYGGFVYLDVSDRVVAVNAVEMGGNDLVFSSKLPFKDEQKIEELKNAKRFHEVTFPSLLQQGTTHFCWLVPYEKNKDNEAICGNGAFLYLNKEGPYYYNVRDNSKAVWEFLSTTESCWLAYDAHTSRLLEEAYPRVGVLLLKKEDGSRIGPYEINFKKFTQMHLTSGFTTRIRRTWWSDTEDSAEWEYHAKRMLSLSTTWKAFPKYISELMDTSFFSSALYGGKTVVKIESYTIDFGELHQISGSVTELIRRKVPTGAKVIERKAIKRMQAINPFNNNIPEQLRKPISGSLTITLKEAFNLAITSTSNVYVVVNTDFDNFTWTCSEVKPVKGAIQFDEICTISLAHPNLQGTILFTIYDFKNKYLGRLGIPLVEAVEATQSKDFTNNLDYETELKEKDQERGKLSYSLCFSPLPTHDTSTEEVQKLKVSTKFSYPARWEDLIKKYPTSISCVHQIYITDDKDALGSGAFGFVSIGESLITDEEVAIKEIYPSQYAAIEIEIMSSLKFRYCVSCIDWKNNPDETYIVMEYCRGGDLFKAIDAEMLTEKRVKRVAKCVLLALEYLHSHYICHRDIKPENILCYETTYDNEEVWKVTDFGLSCYFQPGTPIFGAVGTPHYKAPEIYPPSEYTEAVDLWSLGVTIYVALTAQFVWDGNTDAEIEASMRQGRLEYDQSLSFTAFEWIEQLLQPNPANRMTIPQALTHHWFQ